MSYYNKLVILLQFTFTMLPLCKRIRTFKQFLLSLSIIKREYMIIIQMGLGMLLRLASKVNSNGHPLF
jgi:hypothetical protein